MKTSTEERGIDYATITGYIGFAFGIASVTAQGITDKLKLGLTAAVLTGAAIFAVIMGVIMWGIWMQERRFRFYAVIPDQGGIVLVSHVLKAKYTICLTHFTTEPPSPLYIDALLERLGKGVDVHRLVYFNPQAKDEDYKWLKKFSGKPHYNETPVDETLPFNAVIIDDKIVWIFLPVGIDEHYKNAVWFDNKDMARFYVEIFRRWKDKHAVAVHTPLQTGLASRGKLE